MCMCGLGLFCVQYTHIHTDGYTEFCEKLDETGKDIYKYLRVKGEIGDALVFRHEILHRGGIISNGNKYVLRMDAGYKVV